MRRVSVKRRAAAVRYSWRLGEEAAVASPKCTSAIVAPPPGRAGKGTSIRPNARAYCEEAQRTVKRHAG